MVTTFAPPMTTGPGDTVVQAAFEVSWAVVCNVYVVVPVGHVKMTVLPEGTNARCRRVGGRTRRRVKAAADHRAGRGAHRAACRRQGGSPPRRGRATQTAKRRHTAPRPPPSHPRSALPPGPAPPPTARATPRAVLRIGSARNRPADATTGRPGPRQPRPPRHRAAWRTPTRPGPACPALAYLPERYPP